MFLQQFNFDVKYKQGSTHTNADALSRQPPSSPVSVITDESPLPTNVEDLIKAQMEDPTVQPPFSRHATTQGTSWPSSLFPR